MARALDAFLIFAIPAKAAIQCLRAPWIPAFAGMTALK